MSIQAQPKDSPEEVAAYDAVRALNHYNKPQGAEAVLHRLLNYHLVINVTRCG